jgi:hypothetical protein
MRREHFSAPILAPLPCRCGCGKTVNPTRRWNVFYSPACRKRYAAFKAVNETPADIRATLNRIEDRVRLLADLNLDQRIKDLDRNLADLHKQIKKSMEPGR